MPKVFVSYSRKDLNAVLALEQRIGQRVSLWRDQQKLYGGDRWPKVLGKAIDANDVVLLVWSQHSAASHYVEFEWCTALALRKRIIPWLLDETPLPPSLRAAHGFDARSGEPAVVQLMKSLGRRLPATDTEQSAKVIAELGRITAKQPKAVVRTAKAIFNQHNWVVHGNVFQANRDQHITIQVPEKPQESPDLSLSVDTLDQTYLWKDGSQAQIREVLVRIENNGKATAFEIMPCIRVEDESEVWFDAENFRETGKVYELPAKKFLAFPIFEILARNSAQMGIQAFGLGYILERKFKLTAHFQYRRAPNDSRVYETPTCLFEWSWYQPDILREKVKVKIYKTQASYRLAQGRKSETSKEQLYSDSH